MKKAHMVTLKENILSKDTVNYVLLTLSQIKGILELYFDLDTKVIKIKYKDLKVTWKKIKEAVEEAILHKKIVPIY